MWKHLSFLLLCALGVDEVVCLHCIHCMERSSDYTCKFVMPWESCTPKSTRCFAKIARFGTSPWLVKGCTEYRSCPEIEESGGFCCSGDLCNADAGESQIESELLPAVGESSGSGADELRFPESENVSSSPEPWVLLDSENQTGGLVVTKYGESDIEETSTLRSSEDVLKDLLLFSEPWTLQGEIIGEEVGTNPIYNDLSDLEQTHNISTVEQTLGSVDGEAKLPIYGIVEQAENVSMAQMSEIEKMQIYLKSEVEQGFGNETFERMNIEVGDMAGALYEMGIPERGANATASYDYLGDVQVNIPASDSSLQHTSSTANKDEYTHTLAHEPMSRQPSTHDAQEPTSWQPSIHDTHDAQEPTSRQPSTHDSQEPTSWQPSTHDTHDAQEPMSRQPSTHDTQEPMSRQPSTHDTHDAQEPTSLQPSAHEPTTHAASLELQTESNALSQTEFLKWWSQRLLRIKNDSLMKESADDSFVTSFDFPTNVTADNELSGSPSSLIELQTGMLS
uniref:Uncharacterized protein n=1 Tax=Eptatretus burgeri TaxID=7764 RepID=A0A8C4QSU0_EPTBU